MPDVAPDYITIQTEPATEPVTLAEIKNQLQREDDDENTLLEMYITAARRLIEKTAGKTLVNTTFDYTIQGFSDEIEIPRLPLVSVTSITYNDSDGTSQTLSSAVYTVSLGSDESKGRIVEAKNQSWPTTYGHIDDIVVRFIAGYGTRYEVPDTFKQLIQLLVDHWDKHRSATFEGTIANTPMTFKDLFYSEKNFGWV